MGYVAAINSATSKGIPQAALPPPSTMTNANPIAIARRFTRRRLASSSGSAGSSPFPSSRRSVHQLIAAGSVAAISVSAALPIQAPSRDGIGII